MTPYVLYYTTMIPRVLVSKLKRGFLLAPTVVSYVGGRAAFVSSTVPKEPLTVAYA